MSRESYKNQLSDLAMQGWMWICKCLMNLYKNIILNTWFKIIPFMVTHRKEMNRKPWLREIVVEQWFMILKVDYSIKCRSWWKNRFVRKIAFFLYEKLLQDRLVSQLKKWKVITRKEGIKQNRIMF